jgi:hypothetical protein
MYSVQCSIIEASLRRYVTHQYTTLYTFTHTFRGDMKSKLPLNYLKVVSCVQYLHAVD